jgi:outer membrane protein OmpA-like peptidoglycan-associated protein
MLVRRCLPMLVLVLMTASSAVQAQETEITYYVVMGAFRKEENAKRWTSQMQKIGFPEAVYEMMPVRLLYYVYVMKTTDKKQAYANVLKVKAETEVKDAWVFHGRLGEERYVPATVSQPVVTQPVVEQPEPDQVVVKDPEPVKEVVVEPVVEKPVEEKPKPKPSGKPFLFKLVNQANGNPVPGEVHVMESAKATQFQAFEGNTVIYLNAPRTQAGTFIASAEVPGYQPVRLTIDYNNPSVSSSGTGPDGEFIIPVEMTRVKKGDYVEFNKVGFFANSAIMTPASEPEVEGLAQLMKDHPSYKIRIHGHTNGDESRDMILLGESKNFFHSDPLNKKQKGSAKELSEFRAQTLKDYLVSQGIEGDRIDIKGEGGKFMIYGRGTIFANKNDRVEIEVVKH